LAALSYFLEALPFTKRGAERARIVVVSEEWTPAAVKQALAHGVSGCISSANGFDVLAAALNLVLLGERFVPADAFDGAHERVAAPLRSDCCGPVIAGAAFTPQERRVLAALLEGKSNKKIARDLELCESTVKVHVRHIMRKLSVNNRTQVALCLMRRSGDAVERQSAPA
jgi:DNA-binding NarL/FixJ family response regulator